MKRLVWLAVVLISLVALRSAAIPHPAFGGEIEGTIAFSSLAPRGWDLYQHGASENPSSLTQHPALDYNAAFSPDGARIAFVSERDGNMELYVMQRDGTHVERLTWEFALDDHPAWSPDGRRIAFSSTRQPAPAGRAWNAIYVMEADGSDVRRLSPDGDTDYSPAWSPRGDAIACASGSGETGGTDIWVMNPDGGDRRLVVENGGWPTFIDGGAAIAFHSRRDGQWDVWRVDLDGSNLKRLAERASMPRATPDGTKLALVTHGGSQQIAILDLETSELEPITSDSTDHWNPSIAPDERSVVYHKRSPEANTPNVELWGGPFETQLKLLRLDGAFPAFSPDQKQVAMTGDGFSRLDVMRLDGSDRRTIFDAERRSLFGVSWSNDPQRIAFSHGVVFGDADAQVNIKAVSPDGSDPIELTADAGNNGFPSYSPDGKRLVFRSGRGGAKNLYIMNRDGEDPRRLTEGDWTDTMCDWSPGGEWIAFASDRDNNFEIWRIRPDGSDLQKVIGGGGRHNHPHFSPDGEWIVFTSQRAGLSAEEVSLPDQPQPYGDLFIVRPDGSGLRRLTHNGFEEGTPAWSSATDVRLQEKDRSLDERND